MIQPISFITGVFYKHIAKPILFKVPPDTVHEHLLHVGVRTQRSNLLRKLLRSSWAYQNPKQLKQTIHNITFRNPVGLSAGFDKNFVLPPLMNAIGFGFMEGGSITFESCDGNPKPWFYRLPKSKSLVVHAGLANEGVKTIIKRLQNFPGSQVADFPINISVAKTNSPKTSSDGNAIADYVGCLRAIRHSRQGDMITINISCPNTFGGEPFTTPTRLERLLTAIDAVHLRQPVFIKMPSSIKWSDFNNLLQVIAKHHVAGLTIGNLVKDQTKTAPGEHIPASVKGGLSGKPTWETTNELIHRTRQTYGDRFIIIGVGGIFSAKDAYEKIKLGANLVELITGMVFEGPQLIGQISHGLGILLKKDGFTHISQAVGTAPPRS
jgi:dihydroorotate dehydrogenase